MRGVAEAEGLEHLSGVLFGFNFLEDLFDLAFLVDQESGAVNSHVCSPHEFLLAVALIGLCDGVIRVGEQSERQVVLLRKLFVRGLVVRRNTQDLDASLIESGEVVAERTRLFGATGRIVFRIEV